MEVALRSTQKWDISNFLYSHGDSSMGVEGWVLARNQGIKQDLRRRCKTCTRTRTLKPKQSGKSRAPSSPHLRSHFYVRMLSIRGIPILCPLIVIVDWATIRSDVVGWCKANDHVGLSSLNILGRMYRPLFDLEWKIKQ